MKKLTIIDGKYFYAGIISKYGIVIRTAPILKYMIGWNGRKVYDYCKKKNFKIICTKV